VIQIAIISNPKKISSKLTQYFTGSPAYHIGFVDTERGKFYDMNLLFRRRRWPHYPPETVKLYRCPVPLTADDLEDEVDLAVEHIAFANLRQSSDMGFEGLKVSFGLTA
jgi:hypothetical protein